MNATPSHPKAPRSRRAYTLAELLVVMSIFVLVLAIAIPAFSSLLYSTERSTAENQLSVALGAARSAAMSSEGLGDCAAVFFYDPAAGRTRIGVYTEVGQMDDVDPNDATLTISRDVFVPLPSYQPVQMPRRWMVRAYAPVGSIDTGLAGGMNGWYEQVSAGGGRAYDKNTGNWVFPETGFYDEDKSNTGASRQTFMVRFEAGTGSVSMSKRVPSLVVDPSPSKAFRTGMFGKDAYRLDKPDDLAAQVRRLLASRPDLTKTQRQQLLGDQATDTVLARPVVELAFYDERRLASAIGARGVNSITGSLYGGTPADAKTQMPLQPSLDAALFPKGPQGAALTELINAWIQGTGDSTVTSDARIFTIDHFLGKTREVTP